MIGCADFETTTIAEDCRVWAYSICEIGNVDNFMCGNNLDDFMSICSDKSENHTFYFHNLKFDGEFIFYWLFRNEFELVENRKLLKDKTFCTLISDMGQFYSIEICFNKKGHKTNKVIIYDSLKILNFSVSAIAKGFNLPISKLEIDYKEFREVGHVLTKQEIDYIRNDVEIVARALKVLFDLEMNKMTIGADALNDYKNTVGKKQFEKWFPILDNKTDENIRYSYKGGFTYLDDRYKGKQVGTGIVLDVNSLYPSVMFYEKLPYGEPTYFEGKYKDDVLYPLYVQQIVCQFKLKKDHIPSIQIKKNLAFVPTEYLKDSGCEDVRMTLTNIDLKLFFEQYNVYNIEYINGYKFMSSDNLFKPYVSKWTEQKIKAKKDGNKAMYTLAKLMLNSLYGKFSLAPYVTSKFPQYSIENDKVSYVMGVEESRTPIYIPVGAFVTSLARYKTISSAQRVYDRFVYADTDSLHLLGTELPEDLEIHDTELGAWKNEFIFSKGKYLRQKSYMEHGKEPDETCEEYTKITCAGMPTSCYQYVDFDNFKIGSSFHGKLQQTRVQGGIILKDIDFTIKK